MHLDVCLYVEIYVLIGLDWIEPMMQFLLHVTYSCTFHAYVPFHFLLLVPIVMVFFCLSLSFSLLDSLCMAPKRKSTPSRNSLHSKSSSSDPTLHV